MNSYVTIHYKFKGRVNGLLFKTSVEEITLSMLEAKLYKKLGLDERNVKLQLSYIARLSGSEDQSFICDDEELLVYLVNFDHENRRSVLIVEMIGTQELPEQQSRAVESSNGTNYVDGSGEIGTNAIELFVDNGEENREEENREEEEDEEDDDDDYDYEEDDDDYDYEEDDDDGDGDDDDDDDDDNEGECEGNSADPSDIRDYCMEPQPVVEEPPPVVEEPPPVVEEPPPVVEEPPPVVVSSQSLDPWEDGLNLAIGQEFPNKDAVAELVHKGAFVNSFGYTIGHSEPGRWVAKCDQKKCEWRVRATKIANSNGFCIRRYTKMHTCNRASNSNECSVKKKRCSVHLVASIVSEEYPGKLDIPPPKAIMELVKSKIGVEISYSTALRGKNRAIANICGTPEDNYRMLHCYLHVLEELNQGTQTAVELDEVGKFKYLFIALGACIDGFRYMRKVIVVDATFMKAGFGGVLVFAAAQDPNRHNYPIAFGVLDGENNDSWAWFFEKLKTVVDDSSELVFVSDRNVSLINAIANVYPQAHHGFCLWHLSQNVKGHGPPASRAVIAEKFQECGRAHTVAEFTRLYAAFKERFPLAAKYVEESTVPEKWARCVSPVARYNLDTSNSVESLNKTFRDARGYSLIPMLDTIVRKISEWFNTHRNVSVGRTSANKLVPLVENFMHKRWPDAEKLAVREVNAFDLEYEVISKDGKLYLVSLANKCCSCRFYDIHRYPCIHALSAFIAYSKVIRRENRLELHELCSQYYWTEMWTMAYHRSIYVVPDMSEWAVPPHICQKQIIPPDRVIKKGPRKQNRYPSSGERRPRPRTDNRHKKGRRLAWLVYGDEEVPADAGTEGA